jgi:hypothetical protein
VSRFTAHLGLRMLEYSNGFPVVRGDRCLWYLPEPLTYERGYLGSGVILTVPAFNPSGFDDIALRAIARKELRVRGVTDLTSIPALARGFLSPDGPYVKAAVLHDDGYISRGENYRHILGRAAKRSEVDGDLYDASEALGVSAFKRGLIHGTVRAFGAGAWGS